MSLLVKRTLGLGRKRRTSMRLEDEFWESLQIIAAATGISAYHIVQKVGSARAPGSSLASAVRCFCLAYWRNKTEGV